MTTARQKLDRWIEKLLDTGKRNNLISFKDSKLSTVEVVFPDDKTIFSHREHEYAYAVYEPPIEDFGNEEDEEEEYNEYKVLGRGADAIAQKNGKLSPKEEYIRRYSNKVKSKGILVYSATTNPISALKSIAKKTRELQDETGVNASYLAFGFVRWKEKDDSKVSYKAPLLLVHANVITGSVIDPIKIQISDDEVVVNPTFNYKLQSDFGVSLPDFEDDCTLDDYFSEVARITDQLGWEIVRECKLGIFSFLKLTMYEDLKNNADLILKNNAVKILIEGSNARTIIEETNYKSLKNPLVELHTVVDADSSQMEAVEMAKSGRSFVLQGPPGTGKSQTITNIIAECLYDGKKVLFVSEKQAALNVVFEKLKNAGLEDFCLELHSHKANKKSVIEELNRTLESPPISVSQNAEEEIRQKRSAIVNLDAYTEALHRRREVVNTSLFQLFEKYSALRHLSDFSFDIPNIENRGTEYFHKAVKLLNEYASYLPDVGNNYRENAWYGFSNANLNYTQKNQLKEDIETLLYGYEALLPVSTQLNIKYNVSINNFISAKKWSSLLYFLANSDVITPYLLISNNLTDILSKVEELKSLSDFIALTEQERNVATSSLRSKSEHILKRIKEEVATKKNEAQKEFDSTNNQLKTQLDIDISKLDLQLKNAILKVQGKTTSELESIRIKHESESSSINKSASEALEILQTKYNEDINSIKEKSSSKLSKIQSHHDQVIENIKNKLFKYYNEEIIDVIDGSELYEKLTKQFKSIFSRIFKNEYRIYIETTLRHHLKKDISLSYKTSIKTALLLKKLREEQEHFNNIYLENKNAFEQNVQQIEISYKEECEKTNSSFEKKLREAQIVYDEEITKKKSSDDALLQKFQNDYENIVSRKKAEHDIKVLENQKKYDERITNIDNNINYNLTKIKQQHESAIEKKSSEYEEKLRSLSKKFEEDEDRVKDYLGPSYKGLSSDWNHIIDSLKKAQLYLNDNEIPLSYFTRLTIDRYQSRLKDFKNDAETLQQIINTIEISQKKIASLFSSIVFSFNEQSFSNCIDKMRDCLSKFDKLGSWLAFIVVLQQIEETSLLSFIDQTIKRQINPNLIVEIFKKNFYRSWIDYILFSDSTLSSFTRTRHDHIVSVFSEKDEISFDISKVQIKAKLSRMRPNLNVISGGGPVAILRREGQKKRKQLPIRKLLIETNELTQILKPCFLMSPLSVSSLLDPEKISFDVVIFDEASQVFPQDALGAIYRAKQVIVVGDSKQMPPSNFFNATIESLEDEEEEDVSDFESILDICSSVFTTKRLLWHYRSRYENLISFSNIYFYDSSLMTFPSASTDRLGAGVNHYFVDGIFDRKSKTNRAEAEFIVNLVFKNIVEHPNRSLGVVAFSLSQQKLIDKLITQRREENTSYEFFFDSNVPEPFFVKNLETVQGDERDTIIFSVAYARDAEGRFLQNFGPLNRAGGERRLNVAITRAKDNVQLVSSIRHTDIDTTAAKSKGAQLLKAYLDFAENGEATLEQIELPIYDDHREQNEYLEQEIADFLRKNSYVVDIGIGNSTSKVDLGVKIPNSNNYVMAIECDGRNYRNFKNARDRDRLRRVVLENMGWTYYRIWSPDWFKHKSQEQNKLLLALKEAVNKIQTSSTNTKKQPNFEITTNEFPYNPINNTKDGGNTSSRKLNHFEKRTADESFPKYKQLNMMDIMIKKHVNIHKDKFQDAVFEILSCEAPISERSFLKRIVGFFDRERRSKIVRQEYEERMVNCENKGIIRRDGFLYLRNQKFTFRIPGDKREIKDIAIEELAVGLLKLIEQNIKIEKDNLFKIIRRLLCVSSTLTSTTRLNDALSLLKKKNRIQEEGEFIRLK